jgi:uncharacterized membrane protein YebE (DUF533 family)
MTWMIVGMALGGGLAGGLYWMYGRNQQAGASQEMVSGNDGQPPPRDTYTSGGDSGGEGG